MIVSFLVILTEYIGIICCLHKVAKKKLAVDKYFFMFLLLDFISVLLAEKYRNEHNWIMGIVYTNFFLYTKLRLASKWKDALKIVGVMFITIPSLQLLIYFATKFMFENLTTKREYGVLVNCIVCLIVAGWKERYFYVLAKKIKKISSLVIIFLFMLFFAYLLYLYKYVEFLYKPMTLQTLAGIIGLGVILALWLNTENDKKYKVKELQLYELYNKTFEEAISAIRVRQHEFDNHINAIKCLQLTITNPEDLMKAQNEYCDKMLQENSINKLLKLHTEPIMIGFLYSKFMNAKEYGINVIHEIHAIEFNKRIEVSELVETIGILFDNAVEALMSVNDLEKILFVKIVQESEQEVSIEIANRSRRYLNSEIENFCIYGYSTKGENRGLGLTRVKEIVKKNKAKFYIENINYNGENYLSFRIIFTTNKERN